MSHGTREEHTEAVERARAAACELQQPLSILVDLSGPKIRTRTLNDGMPVELKLGDRFTITSRDVVGDATHVSTNYIDLPKVVRPVSLILVDDGAIQRRVEKVTETDVEPTVACAGWLKERKGINL